MKRTTRGAVRNSSPFIRHLSVPALAIALHSASPGVATAQPMAYVLNEGDGAWELVSRMDLGSIYVDADRVVSIRDDVYRVRTMWRFSNAQQDHEGESFRTSVAIRAVDCRTNSMAILAFADQEAGRTVNRATRSLASAEWVTTSETSPIGQIARRVCGDGSLRRGAPAEYAGGG